MTTYRAPQQDMSFVLNHLADLSGVAALPGWEEASPDLVEAILDEAGKLASEVLSPLNVTGDQQGSKLVDGKVQTPDGWHEAYNTFREAGWNSLAFDPEFGGQGMPWLVATAVQEMWHSSNMSFGLCPMLTQGAIEALHNNASDELKQAYLPKMISGEWTGTMNLTEPQAGSDLAAVRTRAEPEGDHYRISGQKIFITYGDHEMTDNIIHLVLARLPDAPAGVKGISLFVVPKYLLNADGTPGERNDVRTVSLEHKLGIHASPTCVLAFGDNGGAIGYLVGEANRGLEYMFVMMNLARHAVGMEGVAIAEMAYQKAREYARDRVQGRPIGGEARDPIIGHPDIRRMLMTMRAQTEAMRALAYVAASAYDKAARHTDEAERARQQRRLDLLIPIVKGWSTETGVEVASLGVQIHGGMGFIEETGAAQYYRDSRITTIYEGTTGIQANDLYGRKTLRDRGHAVGELLEDIRKVLAELEDRDDATLLALAHALTEGIETISSARDWLLQVAEVDPRLPAAGAVPYLYLMGTVCGAWQMARAALVARRMLDAGEGDPQFLNTKLVMARFYAQHIAPRARAHLASMIDGSQPVLALEADAF